MKRMRGKLSVRTSSIFDLKAPGGSEGDIPTRKEEAYRRILEIVLSGELGGGAYLNEKKLAEAFGMSRAPVREALQMLCSEQILINVPRLGYSVVPITIREIFDAVDLRMLLETESVRLACRNKDESAQALLASLLLREKEIQEDEEDFHSWILKGDQVHQAIAEVSGNVMLKRTIVSMIDLLRRASIQLILAGKNKPSGVHYHRAILEAVLAGDEDKAVHLMSQDLRIIKDLILKRSTDSNPVSPVFEPISKLG